MKVKTWGAGQVMMRTHHQDRRPAELLSSGPCPSSQCCHLSAPNENFNL